MGGTFDPIHLGHLVAAEEALVQFNLDRVIFMPTGQPARKTGSAVIDAEHRYLMAVIATSANPDFDVSRMEIDRPGLTYTVDTMQALREIHGPQAELYFITGADAVWEIATWKDAERFKGLCTFIAATRPGYDLEAAKQEHAEQLAKIDIEFIQVPALAISSTDIRRRCRERRPIRYLVPEPIAAYIRKYGLYPGASS
ncbi:MAG: nicotinic acid mononucleotide adenylyltransferase [Actinobacteria bacterium HGW-Actinobacteria-10]|jgi:nicotinate-nucleotide adenylyltransferase|nr:MAG: nicotinic acid mononucleotide adenylyltransferase [Actinobacteria bacterium HGW-Actinobacteria-10]